MTSLFFVTALNALNAAFRSAVRQETWDKKDLSLLCFEVLNSTFWLPESGFCRTPWETKGLRTPYFRDDTLPAVHMNERTLQYNEMLLKKIQEPESGL